MTPQALRGFAIAIAVVAIIDPPVRWTSRERPLVAVVADDAASALADRITERLDGPFTVVRGPFTGAAATVFAGTRPPVAYPDLARPAFVVLPEPSGPAITIAAVSAPSTSPPRSRVPVSATVRARGARGRRISIVLRAGTVAVDRVSREVTADDEQFDVALSFVPAGPGAALLRVTASLDGSERMLFASIAGAIDRASSADVQAAVDAVAYADVVVDVRDERWAVLFHDPRASWMSTFVRRSVERDTRFAVSSRVITSPGISAVAGRPPSLEDAASLARFDVVVVGAAEALSRRDVAALDTYMRGRGGSVVLLLDQAATGPYEQLAGGMTWSTASDDAGHEIRSAAGDTSSLRATELAWPERLPAGATALAVAATTQPVVWQAPVGAGRLVVSGALDAWRYRDPTISSFDAFWRSALAQAAAASPAAIGVELGTAALAPGDTTPIVVTLRETWLTDAASTPVSAGVSAALEGAAGPAVPVRLWPESVAGRLRGVIRAPGEPGAYRVVVRSGRDSVSARVLVGPGARAATPEATELLEVWANARGGAVLPATRLDELPRVLSATLEPPSRRVIAHPLRSAWWIIPFALALAAEWLWRRRRGLA